MATLLTQALGSPAHALGILSGNAAADATEPGIADMCFGQFGSQSGLVITHMVGVQKPGDIASTLALSEGGAGLGGAVGGSVDPSALTVTPISGLGDSAVFLSGNPGGQSYANLFVWRGTEGFSVSGTGFSDAQTTLTAIAQTILAGQP